MKNVGNTSRGRSQGVMKFFRTPCIGRIARSSLRQHSILVKLSHSGAETERREEVTKIRRRSAKLSYPLTCSGNFTADLSFSRSKIFLEIPSDQNSIDDELYGRIPALKLDRRRGDNRELGRPCRGYEISHPYPYPYPQIFAWISMDISISTDAYPVYMQPLNFDKAHRGQRGSIPRRQRRRYYPPKIVIYTIWNCLRINTYLHALYLFLHGVDASDARLVSTSYQH